MMPQQMTPDQLQKQANAIGNVLVCNISDLALPELQARIEDLKRKERDARDDEDNKQARLIRRRRKMTENGLSALQRSIDNPVFVVRGWEDPTEEVGPKNFTRRLLSPSFNIPVVETMVAQTGIPYTAIPAKFSKPLILRYGPVAVSEDGSSAGRSDGGLRLWSNIIAAKVEQATAKPRMKPGPKPRQDQSSATV